MSAVAEQFDAGPANRCDMSSVTNGGPVDRPRPFSDDLHEARWPTVALGPARTSTEPLPGLLGFRVASVRAGRAVTDDSPGWSVQAVSDRDTKVRGPEEWAYTFGLI